MIRPKKSRFTGGGLTTSAVSTWLERVGKMAPVPSRACWASDWRRITSVRYSWSRTWRTAYRTGTDVLLEARVPSVFENAISVSRGLWSFVNRGAWTLV